MRKDILCHIFALFCVFVWGTTFISTKILLDSFHPVVILLYRIFLVGAAIIALIGFSQFIKNDFFISNKAF